MYPILFRIGDIAISSYMVTMSIAFLVAYILCKGEFKRRGLSEDLLDLLLVANVLGEMLVVAGIFVYTWKIRKCNKPIGWLTAIVFILMGLERFLVEFVRNTTPSFIPGVSLAQLMSIGLVVAGVLKLLQLRMEARKHA